MGRTSSLRSVLRAAARAASSSAGGSGIPLGGSLLQSEISGARALSSSVTRASSSSLWNAVWTRSPSSSSNTIFCRSITTEALAPSDTFPRRHLGVSEEEAQEMAEYVGFPSVSALIEATVPESIKIKRSLDIGARYNPGLTESQSLAHIQSLAKKNKVFKSHIGMGYYDTLVPPVILRNVLENPAWYTQYTPYQAEISQGRLESLLNFQTMIVDLTGLPLSNSSLLDEGTAAAEAMTMCSAIARGKKPKFLVDVRCHPQTIEICKTRAEGLGLQVEVADYSSFDYSNKDICGILLQYPATDGTVLDYSEAIRTAQVNGAKTCVATDLLSLTVLTPPGEFGADIVIGSAQRFGVPMGAGGPHAAFLATSDEYKRLMPGRIIGKSIDSHGSPTLRMAMQTREQHIRRDKATSNICTAQALLANMSSLYGVYHGPDGLKKIADRVHGMASIFAAGASKLGHGVTGDVFFDTVRVDVADADQVMSCAFELGMNFRKLNDNSITVSFDETTTLEDVDRVLKAFNKGSAPTFSAESLAPEVSGEFPTPFARVTPFMTHEVFHKYHQEHEMLRYLARLQSRDLSLVHSMIPLGSCTMKLNATSEMIPITWPELANIHPFAPPDQQQGYKEIFEDLGVMLAEITGFDTVSMQPNSGASGEYSGLMAIRGYHRARGDMDRNICLIPKSAHGTNPASAVMAGMKIVPIGTDAKGNVNIKELESAAIKNKDKLAALMITYPSTHGVYEDNVDEVCRIVHENGGQVYMDGANMNAQVGLTSPGFIGADVCHLNLHKTFCIPHGGGGPGMGPIGVKKHLAPYLPSHPLFPTGGLPEIVDNNSSDRQPFGTVSAAPFGSSLILPISYMYIAMMGSKGLKDASEVAILNANYMMKRLEPYYNVLFKGERGTCAHEFILDVRQFKDTAGVEVEDIAKRLIDYGYHAPTMSWPVSGTLMIEPTESESRAEIDRFCDAMISIREEIRSIEQGQLPKDDNPLINSPHPVSMVSNWNKPYSMDEAFFPLSYLRDFKFWPTTNRVDNVHGDRHLVTTLEEPEVPKTASA